MQRNTDPKIDLHQTQLNRITSLVALASFPRKIHSKFGPQFSPHLPTSSFCPSSTSFRPLLLPPGGEKRSMKSNRYLVVDGSRKVQNKSNHIKTLINKPLLEASTAPKPCQNPLFETLVFWLTKKKRPKKMRSRKTLKPRNPLKGWNQGKPRSEMDSAPSKQRGYHVLSPWDPLLLTRTPPCQAWR